MLHLLSCGIDCYMESDPQRPGFIPLASPTKKILGDNTDSIYRFTAISGDRAYRISGTRGNDCYLAFTVYGGKPHGEWSDRVALNINHTCLSFDENGRFEFALTPDPRAGNEFKLEEDCVCVIAREYFFDREHAAPARMRIESREPAEAPRPLDDRDMALRLRSIATFVREAHAVVPLPAQFNRNVLGEPFGFRMDQRSWGTPDNIYSIGTFALADDEALLIRGRSPECAYWGVQTWNHYMQSFDYRYHRVSLNSSQILLEPDGSFRVIVSPLYPGKGNRVGTAGHAEGIVFCRWLLARDKPEKPACEVVKLGDL